MSIEKAISESDLQSDSNIEDSLNKDSIDLLIDAMNIDSESESEKINDQSNIPEFEPQNDIINDPNIIGESSSSQKPLSNNSFSNPKSWIVKSSIPMLIVSSGHFHTCAISVESSLQCWGNNEHGQCNIPYLAPHTKTNTQKELITHKQINDKSHNTNTNTNININPNSNQTKSNNQMTHVTSGFGHTCSVREGYIDCFGLNNLGQTDVPGEMDAEVSFISAGVEHSCAIRSKDWHLSCWGLSEMKSVPQPLQQDTLELSSKYQKSCGFREKMVTAIIEPLHCWGLEQNTDFKMKSQTKIFVNKKFGKKLFDNGKHSTDYRQNRMFFRDRLENSQMVSVSTGYFFTCAAKSNVYFRCWGPNQLAYQGWEKVQDDLTNVFN